MPDNTVGGHRRRQRRSATSTIAPVEAVPEQSAASIDAQLMPRLGRGIRWSDVVAEMERDRLASEAGGEAKAA